MASFLHRPAGLVRPVAPQTAIAATESEAERPGIAQSEQVARSAGVVSIAIAISRVTGLAREMVMAHLFGAGFSYDAFLLSFRIPNLSRDLFAEGALLSAFIPTFTSVLTREGKAQAEALANLVHTATLFVVGIVCLLGIVFAPQLVWLMAPGFTALPGKFELAVRLTQIMFPFLLLIALAAQATGVLNSYGRFGLPALASTFFNIGSICAGLAIGFWFGPSLGITPIEGMACGVVAGGALQLAVQIPALRAFGFRFRPAVNWSHPGLRRVFSLMLPAVVASAAVQINMIVNTSFASRLSDPLRGHDGPVSWLGYAFRFVQLPLGMFGVAFASALLPSVARSAAAHNFEEFRRTLSRSLGMVLLLTVPSSIALIVLARPIIGAVLQSGRFETYDTRQTATALAWYALGLAAYAAARILAPAFYALSDARTPMYITLLSIALNICVPVVLLNYLHFGFAALALTTSFAMSVECACLFACLRRKLSGIDGEYLLNRFLRIAAASACMAGAMLWTYHAVGSGFASDRWTYLRDLGICLPVGIAVFCGLGYLLRISEIGLAFEVFAAPIRTRVSRVHARIRS